MNYVQEVADKFLEESHHEAILSPEDFTLIAEWEKQEIPKEVVLEAISALCTPQTQSIVEIRNGVKQHFVEWLQQASGYNAAGC